ncbi:MAG: FecR domain-containing protein, partial [Spirochaetales bacterium]|nr:FecR domain-containing protein [Spirochaetales bacterium]
MDLHNKSLFFLLFIMVVFLQAGIFAASDSPVLLMDYYNVDLRLPDGSEVYEDELYEGYPIEAGSSIRTLAGGYAEMELDDSTIIKIDEMTSFEIDNIMGTSAGDKNIFTLTTGKFRAVVATVAGEENYQFNGYSSVCGVRGTDLGMIVDKLNNIDTCFVLDGVVNYTNTATGKTLELTKDFMANTFDTAFSPNVIPADMKSQINQALGFKKLKPEKVKGKEAGIKDDRNTGTDSGKQGTDTEKDTEDETTAESELPEWLQNLLGMEIGSVVIGDETYAKAVFNPTIALGKFKTALYLPIIYQDDMFDPDKWYKPL